MNKQLQDAFDRYLSLDKDPKTRQEIMGLAEKAGPNSPEILAELEDRLLKPLAFGTAGLRAAMAAGFNRMNQLTVIQACQGITRHLLCKFPTTRDERISVVVGHDHRHNSRDFAQLTASVLTSRGIKVHFFRDIVPTPFVPFAIGLLGCKAGIMVTASHNPKQDNGYKVYWENGCQIVPPLDREIANAIAENQEPWDWDLEAWKRHVPELVQDPTELVWDAYYKKLALCKKYDHGMGIGDQLKIVYTAMHGVGFKFAQESARCFGLPKMIPVPEQVSPDPDFPTVKYPNPEEGKEALDLAIRTATQNGAQIILANDPDADRLAVAEKQKDGKWTVFTGNQIGIILAHYIFTQIKQEDLKNTAMLTTLVSSQMLQTMAQKEGFQFQSTQTGFKFLGNATLELEKKGCKVPFAYEEAIGFMVYDLVRDKDGISALAVFSELAYKLYNDKTHPRLVSEYLEDLYQRYGNHVTHNGYLLIPKSEDRAAIFSNLRQIKTTDEFGGAVRLVKITDFQPQQMIRFDFSSSIWIVIRASGTEPKVKYYTEITGSSSDAKALRETLVQFVEKHFLSKLQQ